MSLLWASETTSVRVSEAGGYGSSKVIPPIPATRHGKNNFTKLLLLFVAFSCTLSSAKGTEVADLSNKTQSQVLQNRSQIANATAISEVKNLSQSNQTAVARHTELTGAGNVSL